MPTSTVFPIKKCRVSSNTVIPDNYSPSRPLDSCLEVLTLSNMVIKEVKQEITLFLLIPDDLTGELWVDEEGFLAGNGVGAHDGVDVGDRVATHNTAALLAVLGLFEA